MEEESRESGKVFDSLKLNPQLFINETLNRVDELIDGAFDYFHQEASKVLNSDGTDRSEDVKLGINYIRRTIQADLDKRLDMWERYCHHHCFVVPPGFSLPSPSETSGDVPMDQDDFTDQQVEAQLVLLRKKLTEAQKEYAELNQELQELKRTFTMSDQCVQSVNEVLQLYETSHAHDMLQEMVKVASKLREKMGQLKSKQKEENQRDRREGAYNTNVDLHNFNFSKGLSSLKLDELQGFVSEMNL